MLFIMFITPIKHFYYLTYSYLLRLIKPQYHKILKPETLDTLKSNLKHAISGQHLAIKNLQQLPQPIHKMLNGVFMEYGKPAAIKAYKISGIKHSVALYPIDHMLQHGYVVYHFINNTIASVCYTTRLTKDGNTKRKMDRRKSPQHFSPETQTVDFVSMTYVNCDAEILQNVNAAIYQRTYVQMQDKDQPKFELSL
jgi:hypothetical protein